MIGAGQTGIFLNTASLGKDQHQKGHYDNINRSLIQFSNITKMVGNNFT
jgi:hypothetical protein